MKYILYIIVIIVSIPAVGAEFTRKTDSLELVKFYNSTNGNEWRHKSGWLTNQPVNQWYGIELDTILPGNDKVFVVKSINLSSNKLSGEIPNISFPDISILNLSGNQIEGSIPNFNTPKLQILYLAGNKISGELKTFNLSFLEVIDLSGNEIKGEIPEFSLPQLRLLNLSNNQLSGELPDFNCKSLESIYLNDNKLTGQLPKLNCPKLRLLNLENNAISSSIPELNLPELINLNLKRNSLSGAIPVLDLAVLKELNLSYNQLSGQFPDIICPELRNLEIQNNNFTGAIKLTKTIKIETIRINNNKISELADLKNLKKMIVLKANNNKLSFEDIEPNLFIADFDYTEQDTLLPIKILRDGNQFTLEVTANGENNKYQWQINGTNINDAINKTFTSTEIGNYQCIISNSKAINLTLYTKIVNPMKVLYALKSDSLELVKFYNVCSGLEWKRSENWLSDNLINHWHGIQTDTIVSNGDSLLVVKSINLGNNNLKGNLINFNFPNIEELDLFNNEFTGNIPNFDYAKIKSIDLSNNYFSGSIPNFNLPLIESIDLSNNELTGTIPELDLPKIEYFSISGNQLSGNIPNFNFPKIDLLVLDDNNLSGTIPVFDMPLLTFLEMNNNFLSGDMPQIKTPNLRMLSMENNLITGLPNMTNYKSLEGLYVCKNKLTFEDIEPNLSLEYFDYTEQDTILPVLAKYVDGNIELTVVARGSGNRFQWQNYKNDIYKANDKCLTVPFSDGEYRCKVSNIMATELTLLSEVINPALVSINDYTVDERIVLEVYPNPASEFIYINYNTFGNNPDMITIVNEKGDEVALLKSNFRDNRGEQNLQIGYLSSGNYFLNLVVRNRIKTIPLKIIK